MKILLFFSISFVFENVFIPPAGSKKHYVALNGRLACTMLGGQCKNKCGEKEFRMIYCERPAALCCMRECDPKK
ncbi:beta-defensin 112 [Hippopotamus amphibius kiboko]|uniref:beta-defensin 112 n=1 Tax=Hippopotamus amphibius kiboko TaxID=575201 RepID=UPI0025936C6A|nr:beta-defensin 112 [Hippopotamus amphibius kiboko]